jgi:serine/threonine-protein kinase
VKSCPTCRRRFVDDQADCPLDRARLVPCEGTPPPGVGRQLGSYRLICLLGEGGMGNIYIAAHAKLNRYVAIKLLRPELANHKELVSRFFDEARTVNQLNHPNIVESIDMVEDVIDGAYAVLELLRGPDIKTRLAAGPISIESAIRIGSQVADALAAVHALGIVHRDLKPENLILIERDGRDDFVKLIDFGVAQISGDAAAGVPFGTMAYMAPEQAAGKRVDGRADIYSLGVLLFEMVTGRHPFPSATDHEYVLRHADDPPPRPETLAPRCPRALAELILRCLAKQPKDRFANAAAVADALRAIDPHARPRGGRGGWIVGAAAAIAVGVAAAVVLPRYLANHEPDDAGRPTVVATIAADAPPARPDPLAGAPAPPDAAPTEPAVDATPTVADVPADAEDTSVAISFESIPPGATVYRDGETIPLGVTPFTATLLRSNRLAHIRFERANFEQSTTDINVDASHQITVTLVPRRSKPVTSSQPPAKPKPDHVQREGVIDPFAH